MVIVACAGLARVFLGIPFGVLTDDPAATMHMPFYVGFISDLGLLLWAATATVCFLSYASVRARIAASRVCTFLLASGFLSALLCLDDMLQFHECVFPKLFHISEKSYYAGLLVLVLAYLFHFRSIILRNNCILLIMALALFAASRVFDLLLFEDMKFGIVLEEGTKLLGISFWLTYYWRISLTAIGLQLEGAP
jgi:hypothetical protein